MEALRTPMAYLPRVQGNLTPIPAQLRDQNGAPLNLTGKAVAFRLVNVADDTVKVNNQPAVIVDDITGKVAYMPQAADMNATGRYAIYWITNESPARRAPYDGARYILIVKKETNSD